MSHRTSDGVEPGGAEQRPVPRAVADQQAGERAGAAMALFRGLAADPERRRASLVTDSGRQADMSAAEMLAGAAPGRAPDWHSLGGKKVWRTVRRLQARIVKAVAKAAASREGRL